MSRTYVPPTKSDVITISSDCVGVTNGLRLHYPLINAVGDLTLIDQPRIAIVGSRKASPEGRRRAAQLARDCTRAGVVVISGLAEGIDYAAHTAAIEHGGKTIAVLGTPLDKVYPTLHADLQTKIYQEHLLLSPFRYGDAFVPTNFPVRNRIMARLAMATVIIEASDSSGTLSQAAESIEVGHPVFVPATVIENANLKWPRRFVGDGKPLGRVIRASRDAIDFVVR